MITVATAFWTPNARSQSSSTVYTEEWVNRLYRGFARNLTAQFRFVCFTDRPRNFADGIEQERLSAKIPDYGCMIEPFRLGVPSIIVGLDTVIVGNIDHMVRYCLTAGRIALPRDPYQPARSINGVALVPVGFRHIAEDWRGENDMEWLRTFDAAFIDDLWPGEVLSLKFHKVRDLGTQGARIIYMHGRPKQNDLTHLDWIKENWR